MGEKPLATDEPSGAAIILNPNQGPTGTSVTPQSGGAGMTGEPIPELDVKLGKNPGGG